jgi:hypothetical protein
MRSPVGMALVWLSLWLATAQAARMAFEYPSAMLDLYDPDQSCWVGMGLAGEYIVRVLPEKWLVGTPPSSYSAVTLPADEWMDLLYSGPLVSVDGNDIELIEWGRAGEQALVFVTDGDDQEYPAGLAKALSTGGQLSSTIDLKFPATSLPFTPRVVRIVGVDDKGLSPGFDLGSVRAWVSRKCGAEASQPNPVSGAAHTAPKVKLNWLPACQAQGHILYLSDNESQVTAAAAEARKATLTQDVNLFDPGTLTLGRTYYWRVDEVMAGNSVVPGPVWHFTVADEVLIDDFELYGALGKDLYANWFVRDISPHGSNRAWLTLVDGSIAYSCRQSMAFTYYYDSYFCSELYYPFASSQDWIREGVRVVQLWVYGAAANITGGQLYLVVLDSSGREEKTPFIIPDSAALTRAEWTVCRASVAGLSVVSLNDVIGFGIGFRLPEGAPNGQYSGKVHVDDVSLRPALCLDSERPLSDVNGDCRLDHQDLRQMASQWLTSRMNTYPIAEPNAPILWYEFNGNTLDSAGNTHGQIEGRPAYMTGKHGRAIAFKNPGDGVTMLHSQATELFARTREAITIAFWQVGDESYHLNDTICCSNYTYGQSDPSISINLGCWRNPGQYRWDCGTPWSFANRVAGHHRNKLEWTGRWNHWAFTKDIRVGSGPTKGRMQIYLNGVLYDSRSGTNSPIEGITSFEIGSGWYGRYDGLIDDFQIYDYALSAPEAAYLASEGTGDLEATIPLSADLNYDGFVDFTDYATLASEWLSEGLWP